MSDFEILVNGRLEVAIPQAGSGQQTGPNMTLSSSHTYLPKHQHKPTGQKLHGAAASQATIRDGTQIGTGTA